MLSVPVSSLILDPLNPRLPESVKGSSPAGLFAYLYEHGVLDELVESMVDSGFFENEPLIALSPDENGRRVVIEGNRRLAALLLLHRLPPADKYTSTVTATPEQRAALDEVPVYEIAERAEVSRYLGFRHISGLKPWPAEAKARYVYEEVEQLKDEVSDPFRELARRIGSNAQGVRSSYLAFALLSHARSECGANVSHVLANRFGVWLRCMTSRDIRTFLGIDEIRRYAEIHAALQSIACDRLVEVIGDLSPRSDRLPPVLADSRQVTEYGRILLNERAHAALRKYGDLSIAQDIVFGDSLTDRVEGIRRQIDSLRDQLPIAPADSLQAIDEPLSLLERSILALRGSFSALVRSDVRA